MNKKNKVILLFLFFAISVFTSIAQIDTSFWFAAPWSSPDHTERHNIVVHISTFASPTTTVHLRQPAANLPNKYDTTIVIAANSNFDYILCFCCFFFFFHKKEPVCEKNKYNNSCIHNKNHINNPTVPANLSSV